MAGLEAAPYLCFGLLAGALTDRWNRRRTMVAADLASALVVATLPLAHFLGELTIPHVFAVAFVVPSIGVFFDGASFGALPTLVGRGRIAEANSLAWGVQSGNDIIVPSLVGIALAALHPATLMILDAVSFLISAALLATITRPMYDASRVIARLSPAQLGREIAEGVRFLWRHRGVRTMTMIGTLQCVSGGGFVALLIVWIDRQLGLGTEGWRFGIVYGSWAVGGIVASILLPRLLRRHTAARIALLALPPSALLGLLIPWVTTWWLAGITLAVWAIAYVMIFINSVSYRQEVTPEHLLGRVNTVGRMLSWGIGWTGGAFLAGSVVGTIGLRPTLVAFAAVGLLSVLVGWTSPLRAYAAGPARPQPVVDAPH